MVSGRRMRSRRGSQRAVASWQQHQKTATEPVPMRAEGKNTLTYGLCTLRVVARLGLCMAEGRTRRSVGHELNPPAKRRPAGLSRRRYWHARIGENAPRYLLPRDLGIIGRGRISVGMMPSPCVVSDSLEVLKGSRACARPPRLGHKPKTHLVLERLPTAPYMQLAG